MVHRTDERCSFICQVLTRIHIVVDFIRYSSFSFMEKREKVGCVYRAIIIYDGNHEKEGPGFCT